MPNLECLSTGVSTVYLPLVQNGIREICISKGILAMTIIESIFGDQARFGYKDLIPLFTADQFDPASWLDLFQKRGAQYLFPVAELHDGFQMYASTLSPYNSLEMGPRRDVLGELREGSRKTWPPFCTSSHRAEHQFSFHMAREFTSDIPQEIPRDSLYWPAEPEPKDHF